MLRQILYAEKEGNQPFLIAGSGTMGWDAVGANLIERGDEALVLNTGYFGDAFADWYVSTVLCCWAVEGSAGAGGVERRGRKGGEIGSGRGRVVGLS
jgi:aspartate aminotransferase-like enzyme